MEGPRRPLDPARKMLIISPLRTSPQGGFFHDSFFILQVVFPVTLIISLILLSCVESAYKMEN